MKFYDYLNERNNITDIKKINMLIQRNCKQYLNTIKGLPAPFARAADEHLYFDQKIVRKDREPKGTDPEIFKKFNMWLQKNGHNRRDKSFSAINPKYINNLFGGNEYYVFPIGRFNYTWIDAYDINMEDEKTGWSMWTLDVEFGDKDSIIIDLKKPFKDYFHTDKGIKTAYKKGYETWINCKYYYRINMFYYEWDSKDQVIKEKGDGFLKKLTKGD